MRTRILMLGLVLATAGCEREASEENEAAEGAEQAPVAAGQVAPITEETPGLFAKAAVSADSARAVALAAYPGAVIMKGELEEEDGTFIYSLDLRLPGKDGVTEVHVDAKTGAVIKTEHEAGEPKEAGE